jgi:hypothetical protein
MDQARARAQLAAERARLRRLLQADTGEPQAADTGSCGFRGLDGVRLPAPSPQPRHPNRSVARGSIFLDILNVFLLLLSLFGGGDD